MIVGVAGATGLVGGEMTRILEQRLGDRIDGFLAFASDGSAGRTVHFLGRDVVVQKTDGSGVVPGSFILGATSADAAADWVPRFLDRGATVIDNSSRFRMDPGVPLVVPEINSAELSRGGRLIANPNCSTIQLVTVLHPLLDLAGIRWVSVSTYQSVSGGGGPALEEFERQESGAAAAVEGIVYRRNVLTSIGPVSGEGFCEEETKLVRETAKILGVEFPVYASCARVPVSVGHAEAVVVAFDRDVPAGLAYERLASAPGVKVQAVGATPIDVQGRDEVVAGRIRNFPGDPGILQLWITADNVRKGAALNAVQILEVLAQQPS